MSAFKSNYYYPFFFLACSAFVEKRKVKPNLIAAVLLKVLLLNGGAKEEDDVVNHVGGMLRQIQQHEIEVQSHNTTSFSWINPKKKKSSTCLNSKF